MVLIGSKLHNCCSHYSVALLLKYTFSMVISEVHNCYLKCKTTDCFTCMTEQMKALHLPTEILTYLESPQFAYQNMQNYQDSNHRLVNCTNFAKLTYNADRANLTSITACVMVPFPWSLTSWKASWSVTSELVQQRPIIYTYTESINSLCVLHKENKQKWHLSLFHWLRKKHFLASATRLYTTCKWLHVLILM